MKEKTVSLVEQTANRIVEYFEKNDLKVGDKLPNEYTLAQDLEVGRSTLREAVKMLVSKNILEVRQGSGTYITSLTETVIDPLGFGEIDNHMKLTQDLFEVRFLIEPQMKRPWKKKSIRMEIFTLNWIFNFIVRLLRLVVM